MNNIDMSKAVLVSANGSCGNCEFAHVEANLGDNVECRKNPPLSQVVGMTPQGPAITTIYPRPHRTWWCGAYQPKGKSANDERIQ